MNGQVSVNSDLSVYKKAKERKNPLLNLKTKYQTFKSFIANP
jgi:hypothetical protein